MTRCTALLLVCAACTRAPAESPTSSPSGAPPAKQTSTPAPRAPSPSAPTASPSDRIPLGSPAQIKLGSPVKGPAWCWKEPRTIGVDEHRPAFAVIALQRSMLSTLRAAGAGDDALGDIKQLREERSADKLPVYVVTATPFDASGLASEEIYVVETTYPAAARAFDQQRDVLQLKLQVQGLVANPAGGDAVRLAVERKRLAGTAPYKSSGFALSEYCVVFEPPSQLMIYKRLVLHS